MPFPLTPSPKEWGKYTPLGWRAKLKLPFGAGGFLKIMKHTQNIFLLFLGILLFTACQDVIEVDLNEGETLLVVEGLITDQAIPDTVTLSLTASYFANQQTPRVTGALVEITDDLGNTDILQEVSEGNYITQNLVKEVGRTYTLRVVVEGEEYTAQTKIKANAPGVDSLVYRYDPDIESESNQDKRFYTIYYYGPEKEGTGDFYRLKVYRDGAFLNQPEDLIFANDEFVEGNYLDGLDLSDAFASEETVKVEVLSIPEDMYYFFVELSEQIVSGGLFATPVANIRTNIVSSNPNPSRRAVGYFGGASIISIEGTIGTEDEGVIK